jgi:hypothetical protein
MVRTRLTTGLFGDPVFFGDYPESVRARLGERLPHFTDEEQILLKGSSDFSTSPRIASAVTDPLSGLQRIHDEYCECHNLNPTVS